jgi:hypothetical protein
MNFTTKIPLAKSGNPIDYNSKILSLGSCFAENMGEKFSYYKFQDIVNPFGIIFNPVSIEKLINRVVNRYLFSEAEIFFHNDLWHCYDVHSELSNPDKEIFLRNLNQVLEETHNQLVQASHIIITYGTSWFYALQSSGVVVANCHKMPQSQFEKAIISVKDSEIYIQKTIDLIRKINPDCTLIFTVSPVRHIKDGFVENNVSKAHLLSALYTIIKHKQETINYFPSYEIMMDELRDYRFYAEDMLHPSQTAIDYIWERFSESYVSGTCFAIMEEVGSIRKAMAHKAFNPDSESHQKFLQNLQDKIANLQQQFPHFIF